MIRNNELWDAITVRNGIMGLLSNTVFGDRPSVD